MALWSVDLGARSGTAGYRGEEDAVLLLELGLHLSDLAPRRLGLGVGLDTHTYNAIHAARITAGEANHGGDMAVRLRGRDGGMSGHRHHNISPGQVRARPKEDRKPGCGFNIRSMCGRRWPWSWGRSMRGRRWAWSEGRCGWRLSSGCVPWDTLIAALLIFEGDDAARGRGVAPLHVGEPRPDLRDRTRTVTTVAPQAHTATPPHGL